MPLPSDFLTTKGFEIRPFAEQKQDKAIRSEAILIRDIDLANKRLVAEYPDLAGWFCLEVKNRQEFIVEEVLKKSGVEAQVPRRVGQKLRKRHGGFRIPVLPVIPNYIMVNLVPSIGAFNGLRKLRKDGKTCVVRIVECEGRPYRIPLKEAVKFISRASRGDYDFRNTPCPYLIGETVRVCDGPFASFLAVVTDVDKAMDQARINVEASIFGRSTPLELDIDQIEKV